MPEMIVQQVDELLVKRIKLLARERQCSINEVLLDALRYGLGMSEASQFSQSQRDPEALAVLDGHWDAAEQGIFQEAVKALAKTPPTQFAPESIRYAQSPPGAE